MKLHPNPRFQCVEMEFARFAKHARPSIVMLTTCASRIALNPKLLVLWCQQLLAPSRLAVAMASALEKLAPVLVSKGTMVMRVKVRGNRASAEFSNR